LNSEQDCIKLLDLLYRVVEANRGPLTGTDNRFLLAEGLATKFFLHAASVLYLSRETKLSVIPSASLKFLDTASIDVLARAALETFLIFHYVFVEPKTDEEKDYRYWAWKSAGFVERQTFPVSSEENRQKLAEEKKKINNLHSKLRLNSTYQQLTERQKKRVLKGEWRLLSWRKIAENANLAEILSSDMYRHLSGYSHSSYLSVLQIKESLEKKEQSLLLPSSILTITIATANLIRGYCDLFPRAGAVLTADAEGGDLVDIWIQVGQKLDIETLSQDEDKNS
jgi:hypothetical protein